MTLFNARKVFLTFIFLSAFIFIASSCNSYFGKVATPTPTGQPEVMFVAAENSYVNVDVPPTEIINSNKESGIAYSQNIYLGLNDKITIRLDTNVWQQGSLQLAYAYSANAWDYFKIEDTVSHISSDKYEATLTWTPNPESNDKQGNYVILIRNPTSQVMHATVFYSVSSP